MQFICIIGFNILLLHVFKNSQTKFTSPQVMYNYLDWDYVYYYLDCVHILIFLTYYITFMIFLNILEFFLSLLMMCFLTWYLLMASVLPARRQTKVDSLAVVWITPPPRLPGVLDIQWLGRLYNTPTQATKGPGYTVVRSSV